MFDFLKSFKSFVAPSCLGVDIGTTSIKIAEIAKTEGQWPKLVNYGILESYGHLERLNSAIQTSSLKMAEKETAAFLKTLVKKMGVGAREAAASIPTFSSFITLLETPIMSEIDTAKAMTYQIQQYVPLPKEEVEIEWIKIGEREDETQKTRKQQILLILIPKESIQRYQNVFKLAGLNLRFLEIESLSLARALIGELPETTLIADIGALYTNIAVIDKGFLKYNAQTDFSGNSLTRAVANGLKISVRRAEEIKKQQGLLAGVGEHELSTLALPFLDAIIREINRARNISEKNYGLKTEKIILAGAGANFPGIAQYFEKNIGLSVNVANPFSRLNYSPAIEPAIKELGPTLSVAIGLGIKEI
jgi:type IV pilus assembly protein PilM